MSISTTFNDPTEIEVTDRYSTDSRLGIFLHDRHFNTLALFLNQETLEELKSKILAFTPAQEPSA